MSSANRGCSRRRSLFTVEYHLRLEWIYACEYCIKIRGITREHICMWIDNLTFEYAFFAENSQLFLCMKYFFLLELQTRGKLRMLKWRNSIMFQFIVFIMRPHEKCIKGKTNWVVKREISIFFDFVTRNESTKVVDQKK